MTLHLVEEEVEVVLVVVVAVVVVAVGPCFAHTPSLPLSRSDPFSGLRHYRRGGTGGVMMR